MIVEEAVEVPDELVVDRCQEAQKQLLVSQTSRSVLLRKTWMTYSLSSIYLELLSIMISVGNLWELPNCTEPQMWSLVWLENLRILRLMVVRLEFKSLEEVQMAEFSLEFDALVQDAVETAVQIVKQEIVDQAVVPSQRSLANQSWLLSNWMLNSTHTWLAEQKNENLIILLDYNIWSSLNTVFFRTGR